MSELVSVLLNSYIRVSYLPRALESAVLQDVDHPFTLVLITANPSFQIPPNIEAEARKREIEIRMVSVPPGPVGVGLSRGFAASPGEFVAILDDDDLWEPRKLRLIERAIHEDPDVVYLHNGQVFVDERNRAMSPLSLHRLVRHPSSLIPEGTSFVADANDARSLSRARRFEPGFNNSSITIRRSLLEKRNEWLEPVARGEDTYLFYRVLSSRGKLKLLSDRLTRYRIHSGAATTGIPGGSTSLAPSPDFVEYVRGHQRSIRLVEQHFLSSVIPEARDVFDSDRAYWDSIYSIATAAGKTGSIRSRLSALLGSDRIRPTSREVYTSWWVALGVLNPRVTQALFLEWRRLW